jgi:hypothetical protein
VLAKELLFVDRDLPDDAVPNWDTLKSSLLLVPDAFEVRDAPPPTAVVLRRSTIALERRPAAARSPRQVSLAAAGGRHGGRHLSRLQGGA